MNRISQFFIWENLCNDGNSWIFLSAERLLRCMLLCEFIGKIRRRYIIASSSAQVESGYEEIEQLNLIWVLCSEIHPILILGCDVWALMIEASV